MSEYRPRPPRPPTLREIAEAADVHVSTASRVLRQSEPVDGWSDAALRVRRVAVELGYQRNLWAASLRTRKTTTIGVVMPRLTDGVVARIYEGVEEAARAAGYSVLLSSPPDEVRAQQEAIDFLVSRQVDGLLLSSLHLGTGASDDGVPSTRVPMVQINRHVYSSLSFVAGDDTNGGQLAAQHLIDRGFRTIAVIAGPQYASTSRDRLAGFRSVLASHDIALPAQRVIPSNFEVADGVAAAHRLLTSADRPEAIFTVTDSLAIGALGAARDLGLRVPEDLALIGYNDIPVAAQLPVPLSTIRTPAKQIGATGVRQLLRSIAGEEAESVRLPVELVARGSSAGRR